MKKFLTTVAGAAAVSALPMVAAAQETVGMDQRINDIFAGSTGCVVNLIFMSLPGTNFPWIVLWLVVAATVFTLYFRLHSGQGVLACDLAGQRRLFRSR